MRRKNVVRILLPLALACLPAFLRAADSPPLPNIVIFLVDDMGVMDTSVPFLTDGRGKAQKHPLNDFYHTPSMEKLAERGVRFSHFYAMSVCSPSRLSLVTGQNAARHHTTNWINPDRDNAGPHGPKAWNWRGLQQAHGTLQHHLRERGYRTIHIGKGHFGPKGSTGADPARIGFDVNVGGAAIGQPGSYHGKDGYGRNRSHAVPHLEEYHDTDTFLTEALTLEAKREISEATGAKRPFFLNFAHYAVHSPFQSDPRFAARYKDSGKPPAAQAYATLVEGMDKSLGDLLAHLDELDVSSNTLILFLGDNGGDAPLGHQHAVASSAPLRGKKGSHYEGGMRTVFLAAWAKPDPANPWQQRLPIAAGKTQSQVCNITDIFPTLLGLTGRIPESAPVDGHRLDTLLAGKPDPSRPERFLMHYPHGPHRSSYFTVWRNGPWKLVFHALPDAKTQTGRYELYHLDRDPAEQRNLAGEEPETLARMVGEMAAELERHQAQYPTDANGREIRPAL